MKLYSWNVNGIRAVQKKGFVDWVLREEPDILCLQEVKAVVDQLDETLVSIHGYQSYWHPAQRKGYSGVATYIKQSLLLSLGNQESIKIINGLGIERFDAEGRVLVSEFKGFTLLNIYFPNGGMGDDRVQFKMEFYEAVIAYCDGLVRQGKKVIICGDFNTAHREIDLKNPKANENVSGFLPVERAMLDHFLAHGYIDVFRHLYPDKVQYTWWSYRTRARERNAGWRIDYFYISKNLLDDIVDCQHFDDMEGSDHCPIALILK